MNKNILTYLQLFFGAALFGSATPLSKIVTQYFPVFIAGGLRVLLALIIFLFVLDFNRFRELNKRDWGLIFGIAIIGVLGFTAFLLYGMKQVSGVVGSIIMSTNAAVIAGLSYLFFRDHFGWRKGVAIILSVAGVVVLNLGKSTDKEHSTSIWGILLIVGAVFCEAGYTLFGKAATDDLKASFIAGASALIAVIAFAPLAMVQYEPHTFQNIPIHAWIALAVYGAGTMALGSLLWYNGLNNVDGSTAAGFMGVMPISALLFSYWLLGESFRWLHVLGFGLVFCGIILIIRSHQLMEKAKQKPGNSNR